MTKSYVKDPNGKYKLVDKKEEKKEPRGPLGTPQDFIREIMEGPKLKELDDRLRRVEKMLFQGGE